MLSALPINSNFFLCYNKDGNVGKFAWYHFVLFSTFNYELRKQNNKDLVILRVALGAILLNI